MSVRAPLEARCPRTGARLALRRAWPRGADHLLCEYAAPGLGLVPAQWFADRDRLRAVAADTAGDVDALAADGVLLQRAGADRRLRALRALAAQPGTELVAHRPERRAVARRAGAYAKVVRPGRAGALVRAAAPVLAASARGRAFRAPAVRAHDDATGIVALDALAGRSLHALAAAPAALEGWIRAGLGLAALHAGATVGLPAHRGADEATLTARWLERAGAFGLLPRVDATRALSPLRDGPPGPVGLVHRDLHDKQLLHLPGAPIGMLDLDTLAVGERALDLANLLAHVELRLRQGRLDAPAAERARAALLDAYAPDPATRRRLAAYATASRLRLAAVYAFRPRWAALARDLLADTLPRGGYTRRRARL